MSAAWSGGCSTGSDSGKRNYTIATKRLSSGEK